MKKLQHFFSSRKSWVLPYLIFSVIFVIIPLLLIVVYAFTDDMGHLTLANFSKFFAHSESVNTFVYSIGIAILTTLGCILLGYPVAWILNNCKNLSYSRTLIMLFILPMWINILVRTLATVALFDFCRLPLGEGALIFGMIYNFIPFMIYPIYNTLQKLHRGGAGFGSQFFPSILESDFSFVHAGGSKWYHDGIHAYHFDLCHSRTADNEQHQTLWNNHTGEYKQQLVELRSGAFAHHVVPDCRHFLVCSRE